MSYLDGNGLATLWSKIKQYVDNKIVGDIPDGGVTEVKLSNDVKNKINPISFTNITDFASKVYGGSNSVMNLVTPYLFVGQQDWSASVLGSSRNGRSWGICFCYSATTVHAIFMNASQLYRMIWTKGSGSSGNTIAVKVISTSSWVDI